jgi:colicin import membrane protein
VRIVRSSGNGAFDRSVEAAVFKSDPLPKPPASIREITFVFRAK